MGLFRPYEQTSRQPAAEKGAEPGRGERPRSSTGATAAPRPSRRRATTASEPATPVATATQPVTQPPAPASEDTQPARGPRQPQKKNAPTPTRAQAEAARMERLHPTLSPKERKRADRAAARESRLQNLDAAENTPQRVLARDHVDAHRSITEFTIPLMLAIMAVSLAFGRSLRVQQITSFVMFGLFALWILNIWWVWRGYKRAVAERGLDGRQRGMLMYVVNRMMTLRALRRPAPRAGLGGKA